MFKSVTTAGLLVCLATASPAGTFTYSSSSVDELEYFSDFLSSGGLISDDDLPTRPTGSSLSFSVDRIKRNTTYTFDDFYGGGASSRLSITTGADRQVVDWDFDLEIGFGIDFFEWRATSSFERSDGFYEYFDEDCIEEQGAAVLECLRDVVFSADGVGTWETIPPVPLPASLPLLGAGLLAFGALRRKKRG